MFPSGDKSSVTPYYNYDNNESAYVHLPAFTGGTSAGGSIRILQNSTNSFERNGVLNSTSPPYIITLFVLGRFVKYNLSNIFTFRL